MKKGAKLLTFYITVFSLVGIILWQIFLAESVNYYVVSVMILVLSMLPLFASFEKSVVSAREITLTSTLIAIAVVSRVAFYLIPQVKPISAVVIASAVCLGAERGYIIGAFSAFVSNFIFGQGYWTPFQMVALGLVGLIAGLIFKKIKVNKWTLSIVGFVLSSVLYGVIVDISTVLMLSSSELNIKSALSVFVAGVPFSLTFGVATAVFLFLFGTAFIKKIDRVNTKYDLVQNSNAVTF